jgi:hypothetical protein
MLVQTLILSETLLACGVMDGDGVTVGGREMVGPATIVGSTVGGRKVAVGTTVRAASAVGVSVGEGLDVAVGFTGSAGEGLGVAVGFAVSVGEGLEVAVATGIFAVNVNAVAFASATPVAILSGVAVGGTIASGDSTPHATLPRTNNSSNQNIRRCMFLLPDELPNTQTAVIFSAYAALTHFRKFPSGEE